MRFAFTDDQLLFRDTVADLLAKECPPEAVRDAWSHDLGERPALWGPLAEMGVIGLTVPEEHGGLGMDELDLIPLLTEAGRVALPGPLLETTAVVAPLLAESAPAAVAERWLPEIASGAVVASVQLSGQPFVTDAQIADLLVIEREGRLLAVPGAAARLTPQPSVDGARHLFSVEFDESDAEEIASGDDGRRAADLAFDRGAVAAAGVLVGLAERMIAMTVDYVKERTQFGVPIGSFQAVKHHLADAELKVSYARPVVWNAAYTLARGRADVARDVSMAKCFASDAATLVARKALQCHGAIGYTTEHDLHFWMKRTWALAAAWGDASWHRRRVATLLLDS